MRPTAAPKSSSSSLSGGAIAGIVIGVLAAVAGMALGYSYYQKQSKLSALNGNKTKDSMNFEPLEDEFDDEDQL